MSNKPSKVKPPETASAAEKRLCYTRRMAKKKYGIKTDFGLFQAVIWYDKQDKVYLAEPLAFDRAMTHGKSLVEAKRMAKELIELLVESAVADGNVVVDSDMRVIGKKIKPESVLQLQRA